LMQPQKPRFFLDQREQHSLVGSLCEGRVVLDAFSHSGAFAMQALRAGAEHVVATDLSETCVKAIGANAQRNECFIETIDCDAAAFLAERTVGDFDCIILDPPSEMAADLDALKQLHVSAFRCLPAGGVLATYCRSESITLEAFERLVSIAAAEVGREGRIFARTGQPFDFPTLLNFPEANILKGLILQVE
jgi:23S rRNA (cytosine1962-C5)-methyltransferase